MRLTGAGRRPIVAGLAGTGEFGPAGLQESSEVAFGGGGRDAEPPFEVAAVDAAAHRLSPGRPRGPSRPELTPSQPGCRVGERESSAPTSTTRPLNCVPPAQRPHKQNNPKPDEISGVVIARKYAGMTVGQIIAKDKKGSIMSAPLPPGGPGWDEILRMLWEEIEQAARSGQRWAKTVKKLLTDRRFDK